MTLSHSTMSEPTATSFLSAEFVKAAWENQPVSFFGSDIILEGCVFEMGAGIAPRGRRRTKQPITFLYQAELERAIQYAFLGVGQVRDAEVVTLPVQQMLGVEGTNVLLDTINLIRKVAQDNNWPLTHTDIRIQSDPEIPEVKVILVVLELRTDFDAANSVLHELYKHLQQFLDSLTPEKKEVLISKLYWDVEVV